MVNTPVRDNLVETQSTDLMQQLARDIVKVKAI